MNGPPSFHLTDVLVSGTDGLHHMEVIAGPPVGSDSDPRGAYCLVAVVVTGVYNVVSVEIVVAESLSIMGAV